MSTSLLGRTSLYEAIDLCHPEDREAIRQAIEILRGSLHDITDRQERERELAQTHDLMSNMEELADVGGWEYDSETEQFMMTDGTRRLYGLDSDAGLTLEEWLDAVHPDDRDRLTTGSRRVSKRASHTRSRCNSPHPMENSDGSPPAGRRVTDGSSGDVVRGYIQDITERRERQQELRRSKRAMDEAPVGITLSDPSQDDTPLIYVNDRFEEVTGYDEDQTVGRNCRFLQGEDTRPEPVVTSPRRLARTTGARHSSTNC